MGRILMFIGAGFFIINGGSLLFADDCSTVSFDGQGGGRVMTAICYSDSQGAIPAWLAALVMIAIGVALVLFALRPRSA